MSRRQEMRAVIFDCDGVMFDSRRANTNFYNHMRAHFDLTPMTPEQEVFVHMHTAAESVDLIFHDTPHREAAQRYRLAMDYTPYIADMVLDPELKPLLTRLKPRYGLAVATNRSNTIGPVLVHNGLETFFDIVISSMDVRRPKPHPESLWRILEHFRLPPDRALYVGDSAVDAETAAAAGVPFIAFRNPELPARHHVETLREVGDIAEAAGGGVLTTNRRMSNKEPQNRRSEKTENSGYNQRRPPSPKL